MLPVKNGPLTTYVSGHSPESITDSSNPNPSSPIDDAIPEFPVPIGVKPKLEKLSNTGTSPLKSASCLDPPT